MILNNYVISSLRALGKYRIYSLINTTGLAIGVASALLILLWVNRELSFDKFHRDAGNIYRLQSHFKNFDVDQEMLLMPPAFSHSLEKDLPYVSAATNIVTMGQLYMKTEKLANFESRIISTDDRFFEVFSFKVLGRLQHNLLDDPSNIVISEAMASKYFDDANPVGKTILINDKEYQVSGIIEDDPGNSYVKYNALMSNKAIGIDQDSWMMSYFLTFFRTNKAIGNAELSEDLNRIAEKSGNNRLVETNQYHGVKLTDVHLHSNIPGYAWEGDNGSFQYVILFTCIAVVILAIACINYINLTSALLLKRTHNVTIRKIIGATRTEIVLQYFVESTLLCLASLLLAGVMVELFMPYFNELIGGNLAFNILKFESLRLLLLLSLIIGLIAGGHSASYIAGITPSAVLRSASVGNIGKGNRILIGFQFFASLSLLVCGLAINKQLNYMQTKRLGFDKDRLISVQIGRNITASDYSAFRKELSNLSVVQNISHGPIYGMSFSTFVFPEGLLSEEEGMECGFAFADYEFINTMGLNLLAGRDFDQAHRMDSVDAIIINQAAAKKFGWDQPLDKILKVKDFTDYQSNEFTWSELKVIGVVEDYHFASLKEEVMPMVLRIQPNPSPYMVAVRFNGTDPQAVIQAIEGVWKKFVPLKPLNYRFLDDYYGSLYTAEMRLSKIVAVFTGLTVSLALIGLLGIFSFSAETRKKEIGIRKVFGASTFKITLLMIRDYNKIILISAVGAFPVAAYMINRWMETFAYRTTVSVWVYIEAIVVLLAATWLALVYQVLKSSTTNPVNVLRND